MELTRKDFFGAISLGLVGASVPGSPVPSPRFVRYPSASIIEPPPRIIRKFFHEGTEYEIRMRIRWSEAIVEFALNTCGLGPPWHGARINGHYKHDDKYGWYLTSVCAGLAFWSFRDLPAPVKMYFDRIQSIVASQLDNTHVEALKMKSASEAQAIDLFERNQPSVPLV